MSLFSNIINLNRKNGIKFRSSPIENNILLVSFSGKCQAASRGNDQGEFIYEKLNSEIRKKLPKHAGLLVDFSDLDYTFGNYIWKSTSLIDRLETPRAIVFSDKSKNMILNPSSLYFNSMEKAIENLISEM